MQAGDKPNPVISLLRSRKFLVVAADIIFSVVGHFAAEYASAKAQADILYLTALLQPVIIYLIKSMKDEDTARTQADADVAVAAHQAGADIAVAQAAAVEVANARVAERP